MRLQLRRILVAVADGAATAVVRRAADLAAKCGARVELLSVVRAYPDALGWMPLENGLITRTVVDQKRLELQKLSRQLHRRGIPHTCTVVTAYSVADGIVRRAKQSKADLVAIQAQKHNLLARIFLSQNDYDLVRHCPLPLLIVKPAGKARGPVLAAVDPWQFDGKPRSLDGNVIAAARMMSEVMGVSVHSAHVHSPIMRYVDNSPLAPVAYPNSVLEIRKYTAMIRKRFTAFNLRHGIAARNTHLQMGDPALRLPEIARSSKARMMVMGAVSRAPIKRILIGNTAERVLDAMPCDIVVVKPDGFRSPVN